MNVLADFHHPDLWWSLHLLFEKRLGWKLFRPIGMDWFEKGFHHINDEGHGLHTAKELSRYLLLDSVIPHESEPGMFYGEETQNGCSDFPVFRGLGFTDLPKAKIDILVCSTRCSEKATFRLRERFLPKAKIVRQVGNWLEEVDPKICPNVLCSDKPSFKNCKSENKLFYHQEFDLEMAKYEPPRKHNRISSFRHHFYLDETNYQLFEALRVLLPSFDFYSYGEGNPSGKIWIKRKEIKAIKDSTFVWQTKSWDGYGFNIHRAMAMGRPVIVCPTDYVGKTAEPLLEDEVTCLFVEDKAEDMANKIDFYSEPERHLKMCENAHKRFQECIDFDKEFAQIKEFLSRLI